MPLRKSDNILMVYYGLEFLHTYITLVVLVIISAVLFLSLLLLMRRYRAEQYAVKPVREDPPAAADAGGTLKQLLKEIQAAPVGAGGPVHLDQLSPKDRARLEAEAQAKLASAGNAPAGAEALAQLRKKEAELLKAQEELKKAENQLKQAQSSKATGPTLNPVELEALQEKIQDLEARLKEYEIIEDDIADLSTYKEENSKLREELEKFQSGDAAPSATNSSVEAEETEAPAAALETSTEEGDLTESPPAGTEAPSEIAMEVSDGVEEPDRASETVDDDNTMAGEEPTTVDPDRLLSEVDDLLAIGEELSGDSSGLEEDLDTDKLLKEASAMPGEKSGT